MKLLFAFTLMFIKLTFFPDVELLFWMGVAICLDFISGVARACVLKEARTSSGFRKTIIKFLQYGGALAVGIVLSNSARENKVIDVAEMVGYFNDALCVFIIYIEVTSVFENMYEIDKTSKFARFFILPIYRLLTVQVGKLSKIADQAEKDA